MTDPNTAANVYTIDLNRFARVAFRTSLVVIGLLLVFDYVFNYLDVLDDRSFRRIWNIARENSIPTWVSSMLAHLLAITVFAIAATQRALLTAWKTAAWVLIGLFFLWIGIDDFAEIHEKLGGVLERLVEANANDAVADVLLWNPSFSWHTFILPVFAAFGLFILGFLWMSFRQFGLLRFLTLGFSCWAVAQGIDFVEGLDEAEDLYERIQSSLGIEREYGVTHTFKVVEETLEMLGTTLLWTGFLYYLARVSNGLQFRLDSPAADP